MREVLQNRVQNTFFKTNCDRDTDKQPDTRGDTITDNLMDGQETQIIRTQLLLWLKTQVLLVGMVNCQLQCG